MHEWGDTFFQRFGKDLYKAEKYIHDYVKRYSLCNLISKEKWGTLRYEYIVPPGGHVMCRVGLRGLFKRKMYNGTWDYPVIWAWNTSLVYRMWQIFGWKMVGRAIKKAAIRWPHLKDELYQDAAGLGLLGKEIEGIYWTSHTKENDDNEN